MNVLKKLYGSLAARLAAALILVTAGIILSDLYREVSIGLAMLGFVLMLIGLLLIPGLGLRRGGTPPEES